MNLLALLHPSARRSVFSLSTQRITGPLCSTSTTSSSTTGCDTSALSTAAGPMRRPRRRPHSKNCKSLRRQRDQLAKTQQQHKIAHTDGNQEVALETDVERVRRQIAALDRRLSLLDSAALVSRQNAQSTALQMMETYHRLTCRGYTAHDEAATQFMYSLFLEDVRCPDFTGLHVMLQQWEQLSVCHTSLAVDTKGLNVLPTEMLVQGQPGGGRYNDDVYVIKSFGTTTCRISRKTIERIFPHVLHDEPLVQWLIGKQYAFSYTMHMHVNCEGKIFQFESKVDLTSALLNLLHDPLVTLKMVEASTMTRSGNLQLQNNSDVREAQNTIENGLL